MMTSKTKISVSEALKKIELGQSILEFTIDFDKIKVESLDVMKLVKAGIKVPEHAIFYNDEDILDDEEDVGNWQEIEYDPIADLDSLTEVKISLKNDIRDWIESEKINLDKLLENLLDGFYKSQKSLKRD